MPNGHPKLVYFTHFEVSFLVIRILNEVLIMLPFTPRAKTPRPSLGVGMHSSLFGGQQEVIPSPSGSKHTIETDEKVTLCNFVNALLGVDEQLVSGKYLPLDCSPHSEDLFAKVKDGLILIKLINKAKPGTIKLNRASVEPSNRFQINENLNLVISGAHSMGLKAVNIGAQDIADGR